MTAAGAQSGQPARVPNLSYALTQAARRTPARDAVVRGARRWTWAEFDARVHALACAMVETGLGPGSVVMVHSPNCLDLLTVMYATWRIGAIWAPANYRLFPDDIASLILLCQPDLLICHVDYPRHAAAAGPVPTWALASDTGQDPAPPFGSTTVGAQVRAHAGQQAAEHVPVEHQPAWYFFTSGSSGTPKVAVLTHSQMAFVITSHLCDLMPDLRDRDATLILAPISHGAGVHLTTHVARGAKIVLLPDDHLDPGTAWQLIAAERVSTLFTVPTILARLTQHNAVTRYDRSSLRYVIYAGAPITAAGQQAALDALGPVLVQYYGLGEVTGNITVQAPWQHDLEPDAAGILPAGYERTGMQVAICDPEGRQQPPGVRGEICVCGPAVFPGYLSNPAGNARAFRDGWFRTGDLGYLTGTGLLYIAGRASDMFISGGSNIDPREVELKVLSHPDVDQVGVVGVPDLVWGEVGYALCVPRPGASLDPAALLDWCHTKMPGYKVPKKVVVTKDLPVSGYGKVTRQLLTEELKSRGLWPS